LKFKSKQDWWLTAIVWGPMLFAIGSGVMALITEPVSFGEALLLFCLTLLLPVILIWMWLTTYYVLDESSLIIRFGPFKKVIPLNEIRSVKKTSNPLSSPALSLKRLKISYGRYDFVLISPTDRDEFMKILAKKCPNATIEGLRN
jgi:hypothetical protein